MDDATIELIDKYLKTEELLKIHEDLSKDLWIWGSFNP